MDPNVVLERLREALKRYRAPRDMIQKSVAADEAIDAAEDLDNWLSHEGFPPDAWFGAWHRSIGDC